MKIKNTRIEMLHFQVYEALTLHRLNYVDILQIDSPDFEELNNLFENVGVMQGRL